MNIKLWLNGQVIQEEIAPDMTLYQFVRAHGCASVKCGCETTNCGLCTVILEGKPILSCAMLAVRAHGMHVETLEGLQEEAVEFGTFLANQGADQCGFCNPGFVMNVIAMLREIPEPTDEEIGEYLSGNLCRCSGYVGQMRAIKNFLAWRKEKQA
ncbi:MAG: (2Fe-2S)-binding protein [Lachnospiraceae bacterium]